MSRTCLRWIVYSMLMAAPLAALAAGGRAAAPAPAGDLPPKPPTVKEEPGAGNKRLLYLIKHGTAKDLATVLSEHFKGVAEIQALPDSTSNCLLISAAPAALDEVVKVLDQLDHQRQTVSIQILILEIAAKKAEGDKPAVAEEVDENTLSGAMADVEAKVEALQKKGVVANLKRLQLTTVEGLPASVMIGENKPFVSALNTSRTGLVMRSVTYRNLGVKADVMVRVSPEKVVTLDLKLEDSYPVASEDGISIGTDENGKPVLAPDFMQSTLSSKLDIASGKAQAAHGVKTVGKSGKTYTAVIVGARVVEADGKAEK